LSKSTFINLFIVKKIIRSPLSANVEHARHDADVACSGCKSLKMASVFLKEEKVC